MIRLNQKQKIYFAIIVLLCITNIILGMVITNSYSTGLLSIIGFNGTVSIILTAVLANSIIDSNLVKIKKDKK